MGDVMTELQNRSGIILGMEAEGNYQKIKARVPLAELNRYSTTLSSLTSGKAKWQIETVEKIPIDFLDTKIPYRETKLS